MGRRMGRILRKHLRSDDDREEARRRDRNANSMSRKEWKRELGFDY